MHRPCVPNLSINHRIISSNLTERLTRTCEKYRVLMTVSDPNVSRVPSIKQRTRKNTKRVIPFHKNPPHDSELLELILECGRNFRGGGEGGQVVVICGGEGGGRNTNSYAMIMFCVREGAVYIHLARGLTNDTALFIASV